MIMNEKQALEILKAALDLATSKGVFMNLNDCNTIIQAYNIISQKLIDGKDNADTN